MVLPGSEVKLLLPFEKLELGAELKGHIVSGIRKKLIGGAIDLEFRNAVRE